VSDPTPKTAEFRFSLEGVFTKQAPDLLKDGRYRRLLNVCSNQEGSLSSRTGIKKLGYLSSTLPLCYQIRKLSVFPEANPLAPGSGNPRYLGIYTSGLAYNLYRTYDYTSATTALVASNTDTASKHWEMAAYSAGDSGDPWAYFACPTKMLKDRGASPYSSLPNWGVLPAFGVATATINTGNVNISAIAWGYNGSGVVITLATPVGLNDYDQVTISGVPQGGGGNIAITTTDGRSNINDTWSIRVGFTDTHGNIINPTTMFQIFDKNGQGVSSTTTGTIPVTGGYVVGVPTPGKLDGGAENSADQTQAYDWRYCYVDSQTNNAGNPSQTMLAASAVTGGTPVAVHNGQVTVTIMGTSDNARLSRTALYRRGGILYDAWRLLAYLPTPGAGATATYIDNMADADLQYADPIETDNDPPVTSTVPTPLTSTLQSGYSSGRQTISLTSAMLALVTNGSLLHIYGANPEDCVIESVQTSSTAIVYLQCSHTAGDGVEVDAITNQPCNLACSFPTGDCLLVAGDPNNPHVLYKSKSGSPEAFPVGTDAAGAVTSIGVGTPSNGIVNMCDFRGQVLCLNASSLFEVALIQGSLVAPAEVAPKGLVAQSAWCETPTEVWFLSTDGVWSWDGGSLSKRSEAIDPIFHGEQINGLVPINMTSTALLSARMEYRRNAVRLVYQGIDSNTHEMLCEPLYGDRWIPYDEDEYIGQSPEYPITAMYQETDTGSLILAINNPLVGATFGIADCVAVSGNTNYASDWWTTAPPSGNDQGAVIPWDIRLPWFDLGSPHLKKLFEEIWLDLDPQLSKGVYSWDPSLTIELLLDYAEDTTQVCAADSNAVDSFTVTLGTGASLAGRQMLSLLPQLVSKSGKYQSYGREARAVSFHIWGSAFPVQCSFYRLIFQYQETGLLTAGGASDWRNEGSRFDKKFSIMTVEFDAQGVNQQVVLDTITGPGGNTYNEDVATFTLAKNNVTVTGAGRCLCSFPVTDLIAKEVRVRPVSTVSNVGQAATTFFKITNVWFEKEEFPPDILTFTPWEDGGSQYDKYANQIDLEVNTNGQAVTVNIQADGANVLLGGSPVTVTVTTTEGDRRRNVTLPSGLKGKQWRLYVDPSQANLYTGGGTGMWQLFRHGFVFQPADKGEVVHTQDWRDEGWPHDKRFRVVNLEWDNTGGADVVLQMDLLSGIGGATVQTNVASFDLGAGTGRSQKSCQLPDGLIGKKIRVYPASANNANASLKSWAYTTEFEKFPPDTVLFTEPKDFEWPFEKVGRNLILKIDTGGVACAIQPMGDGSALGSALSVTTTLDDWQRILPLSANLIAKLWKLGLTPGTNGKAQLFDWNLDFIREPPSVTSWTSNELTLGYPGWKFITTLWLEYLSPTPLTVTLTSDTGSISNTFPAHTTRYLERFLWPTVWGTGLNKSKVYIVSWATQSTTVGAKVYPDASRLVWFGFGEGRHASYHETKLSEFVSFGAQ